MMAQLQRNQQSGPLPGERNEMMLPDIYLRFS
jgi:hypothetical protein